MRRGYAYAFIFGFLAPLWSSNDEALIDRLRERDALFWTTEERQRGLAMLEHIKPTRMIEAPRDKHAFVNDWFDLSEFNYQIDEQLVSLEQHLSRENVAGLLVLHQGFEVVRFVAKTHSVETRWNSFSIAKSILVLMFGSAVEKGHIQSIDAPISEFLSELSGSPYERVSLKQLMHMSSGVAWSEDYTDPQSDVARLSEFTAETGISGLIRHMGSLPKVAEPGTLYNYNTGEIYLLGAALARMTGQSLSQYLSESIWKPLGMEREAFWMLDGDEGLETAGCCIAATLGDYARIGQLVLNLGKTSEGTALLPADWIHFISEASPTNERYGALWFRDGPNAIFAAGIFGQLIYVDFKSEIVIAMQSHWPEALTPHRIEKRNAFVRNLSRYVAQLQ